MQHFCSNPSLVAISGSNGSQKEYILYTETEESPFTFTHNEFSVTSSLDLSLCGNIVYVATYDASTLTSESSPPISYNARQFSVFSEDISLVGLKTITVNGSYEDYSSNDFEIAVSIDFVSPCVRPDILVITAPTDVPASSDYLLTDSDDY